MNMQRILFLLEDDKVIREALERGFSEDSFQVYGFTNEREFRQALKSDVRPDVMVLDIMVPAARLTRENYERHMKAVSEDAKVREPATSAGMRITHDIKKYRKYPLVRSVPIVIYTILENDEYRKQAANLGVKYFVKGTDGLKELRRFVARIVKDA